MSVEFLGAPLTLQRITEAYAKTGLKPRRRLTLLNGCACPLAAVAVAEGPWDESTDATADVLDALNPPPGFITGFDDEPIVGTELLSGKLVSLLAEGATPGYKLGQQVAKALLESEA